MSDEIKIKVKTLGGGQKDFEITIGKDISVPDLKQKLEGETGVPPGQQRLIYLGKVLKDEDLLAAYQVKDGGTLHMVARPQQDNNQPIQPNANAPQPTPVNQAPPPIIGGSPSGGRSASIVMGVMPGSNGPPNLDNILSSVLNSIGLGAPVPGQQVPINNNNENNNNNDNNNNNNNNNNITGPFSQFRQILQALENQVTTALGEPLSTIEPAPENATVTQTVGHIIDRTANANRQLLPVLERVAQELQRDSVVAEERAALQRQIGQIAPALQQLGLACTVLSSSLLSMRVGNHPDAAYAADTSGDVHRSIVGPRGNVSIHVATHPVPAPGMMSGAPGVVPIAIPIAQNPNQPPQFQQGASGVNVSPVAPPLDLNSVFQNILGAPPAPGSNNNNAVNQPPQPNGNNNNNNNNASPFGNILSSLMGQMMNAQGAGPVPDASGAPPQPGANQNNPLEAMLGQLMSGLQVNGQPNGGQGNNNHPNQPPNAANPLAAMFGQLMNSVQQANPNQANNNANAAQGGAGPSLLRSMLQGMDQNAPLSQLFPIQGQGYEESFFFQMFHLVFSTLTIGGLLQLQQGDFTPLDTVQPLLRTHLQEHLTQQHVTSLPEFSRRVTESFTSSMDENNLPPHIRQQIKPGFNLTQIFLRTFEERFTLFLQMIMSEERISVSFHPWLIRSFGLMVDRLAEGLNGGSGAAIELIQLFIQQRLSIFEPRLGPMAAMMLAPTIVRLYQTYQSMPAVNEDIPAVHDNNDSNNNLNNQQEHADSDAREVASVSVRSASELSDDQIQEVINQDKIRQRDLPPQRTFSDAYLQGTPAMKHPRVLTGNDLADRNNLLINRLQNAVSRSGASFDSQNFVRENPELTDLFVQQLAQDLEQRLSNDPDYSPDRYPNTEDFIHPSS